MSYRDSVSREKIMPTEHFRSKEAYRKSRAYTHMHGIPTHAKEVVIGGKRRKVAHGRKRAARKRD